MILKNNKLFPLSIIVLIDYFSCVCFLLSRAMNTKFSVEISLIPDDFLLRYNICLVRVSLTYLNIIW